MELPESCNKKYMEAAAQIWCHDAVSHIEMMPELAMLVSLTIKYWHEQGYDEGRSFSATKCEELATKEMHRFDYVNPHAAYEAGFTTGAYTVANSIRTEFNLAESV